MFDEFDQIISDNFGDKYFWLHNVPDCTDGCAVMRSDGCCQSNPIQEDDPEDQFSDFQRFALNLHNNKRAFHRDTPPVKLNKQLCQEAEDCANRIKSRFTFDDLQD